MEQNGMGHLKMTPSGIQLNGEAMAMDTLMTSHVHARNGRPLLIDSSQNITLTARDNQGRSYNQLFLGKPVYFPLLINSLLYDTSRERTRRIRIKLTLM